MTAFRLTALGGASEIGASCFLLQVGGTRLLLDAGTHPRRSGTASLPDLPRIRELDGIFVTHGHMDHVGALPIVSRRFPRAQVFWSRSSEAVVLRQLHSAVAVMKKEVEERSPGAQVLFDHELVDELAWKSFPIEPGQVHDLDTETPVAVRPFHTGHVLGSTGFVFETPFGNVAYTGDICLHERELQPRLEPPGVPVDILIVESTYGASPDYSADGYEDEVERFAADCRKVFERGGSVLVPSFALGRTQEMLAMIKRLRGQGRLPRVPVFMSGLGRAMSEIHDNRREDPWLKPYRLRLSESAAVFEGWMLDDVDEILERPKILLMTSGMMIANTMSALLAERMVREERHAVFFVGYVDPAELGYQVLAARRGDLIEFQPGRSTRIETGDIRRYYFSAHADRAGIVDFCERLDPRQIVLVHGDPPALDWLATALEKPGRIVSRPENGETLDLSRDFSR
jgi:Cft2 family RNA processing exonuclease